MTKVDVTEVSKIIERVGKEVRMPSRNIDQALGWAVRNYSELEIEGVSKRMEDIFLRRYKDAVDRVLNSDPRLKDFMKKQNPGIKEVIATNIAYGALAAIAYQASCKAYGDYVRTFEQEAFLFGMPGSSAEFLDEVDNFLGRN
jgi:hypothetical protein